MLHFNGLLRWICFSNVNGKCKASSYVSCESRKHLFFSSVCIKISFYFHLLSLPNLNPPVYCCLHKIIGFGHWFWVLVWYLHTASSICCIAHNKPVSDSTSRLPGPSRVPAAGSSTKVQGASNLNRRSQSFNSIDKNKPPQYANGNEKGKWLKLDNLLYGSNTQWKKNSSYPQGSKK